MNSSDFELFQKLISDLIVPAFCVKDGCIVAANNAACDLLPLSPVGKSVYEFFPEAKVVSEFSSKSFDVVSVNGIEKADVSALFDLELWQLTPTQNTPPSQGSNVTKNEITLLLAQINLLQRHCPDQSEMFSAIYKSCCKLLKATSSVSKTDSTPVFYVFDLAKEVQRFMADCSDVFRGLNLSVESEELCRFTYISADKNILDNIFACVLCLCAHESENNGSITISVTKKNDRALLSFALSSCDESKKASYSESDKELTRNILQNDLAKIGGMLFTVSDADNPCFIISFPIADDEYIFSDCPVFPSVGIPAHLIQLSSLLPSEFYSKLN